MTNPSLSYGLDVDLYDETNTECGRLKTISLPRLLGPRLKKMPHVLRLLAENHIRQTGAPGPLIEALDCWLAGRTTAFELTFQPGRLLMHDTTCTPALADLAGLRDAVCERGGAASSLSPVLPVDVSVDHSTAVNFYARSDAAEKNLAAEIERNRERYAFLKWAAKAFANFRVYPPGSGIMHTINLEQLSSVLSVGTDGLACPDMMLGTDSHTPMVNGIGVLGWGIGGLEAESIMLGQPVSLAIPRVVGVRLDGKLPPGIMPTDLALNITSRLRQLGVTGAFVEFFGPGVPTLSADARAVVANMAPEYGATTGFFPVDPCTLEYLERTCRPQELINSIEPAFQKMGLWFDPADAPRFDQQISLDLATLGPSLAGPKRPQDRIAASDSQQAVETAISRPLRTTTENEVPDGAVAIAAITSCTNTSDPRMLVAAGLLARKARNRGLRPPQWVKTSLAPGSPSARGLLEQADLLDDLSALGFDIVGFGCTTCIGNSGALADLAADAQDAGKSLVAILSGNRNFPGRVHPALDLGFLASPPMVIAFALRGDITGDVLSDPIGFDQAGTEVHLADIWPSDTEIDGLLSRSVEPSNIPFAFAKASDNRAWEDIPTQSGDCFNWDGASRTLRRPLFASADQPCRIGTFEATPLLVLGDDVTTDHISPAGQISPDSEAGRWLLSNGADPTDLNVYASYRGNWEVMIRGLFDNAAVRNHLGPSIPRGATCLDTDGVLPLHRAARCLTKQKRSSVILAGDRYGMGSSRDWAAKGVAILGVRAVLARSFERIHRANLIGMGVAPIQFTNGFVPREAGISPTDRFLVNLSARDVTPGQEITVNWLRTYGESVAIGACLAIETQQEASLLKAGGLFPFLLGTDGLHVPAPSGTAP